MAVLLVLLFLVVPIAELAIIVRVADATGVLNTLALLILISVVGAWLVRREGMGVWRRFTARVAAGEVPTDEIINGALILGAGALMLTPGFLTDGIGLLLLFPPTRAVARRALRRSARGRITMTTNLSGPGFTAGRWSTGDDVTDVDSWEDPPQRPELS